MWSQADPVAVVALDLSKTSTGIALATLSGGAAAFPLIGRIRPAEDTRRTKWAAPVVADILEQLDGVLRAQPWFAPRAFSIAIEANLLGRASSEFQYHLTQAVLGYAAGIETDVVLYNPLTLKACAKAWSARTDLPGTLKKPDMEEIYRRELLPRNPELFPSLLRAANDAVDAAWLALLALYAHAHLLPCRPALPAEPLLWANPDPLAASLRERGLNRLSNLDSPSLAKTGKALLKAGHLGLASDYFFPFAQLAHLRRHVCARLDADWDRTVGHLRTVLHATLPAKRHSAQAIAAGIAPAVALDASGRLIIT